MTPLSTIAPAKINLTLRVLGRRADGYHDLESLVAFAGIGDRLTLEPGDDVSLTVRGPNAAAAGPDADNLVLRAIAAIRNRKPHLRTGRFVLTKRLPVAAGIGGGSSDAAAALRLVAQLNGLAPDDPDLIAAAAQTGADIPVCLVGRATMMRGIGDRLSPLATPLRLPAVLVNPRVPVPTPAVFRALAFDPARRLSETPDPADARALAMSGTNDLQGPAITISRAVADALDALTQSGSPHLVRMSGSGATCFALYPSCRAAAAAARAIRLAQPGWWVRNTVLR